MATSSLRRISDSDICRRACDRLAVSDAAVAEYSGRSSNGSNYTWFALSIQCERGDAFEVFARRPSRADLLALLELPSDVLAMKLRIWRGKEG